MSAKLADLRSRFTLGEAALAFMTARGARKHRVPALLRGGLAVHLIRPDEPEQGWQITHALSGLYLPGFACRTERQALIVAWRLLRVGNWERPTAEIMADAVHKEKAHNIRWRSGPMLVRLE